MAICIYVIASKKDRKKLISLSKCPFYKSSSNIIWGGVVTGTCSIFESNNESFAGEESWLQLWSCDDEDFLCQGTRSNSHHFRGDVRSCTHMLLNPGGLEKRIITVPYYMWEDCLPLGLFHCRKLFLSASLLCKVLFDPTSL